MSKRIHIFRVGKHTAMDGKSYDFTEAMLADAVAAYDPALHEAPLVIGHPKTDDPAYGWAKSLHFSDGQLEIEPCETDPAFMELVNNGRYKKCSASWYLPDSPQNPKPGSLYLRHVGFLGAQPPAIKGLKSASFNEAEQGVVEFADYSDSLIASMFRRMRDWIISKDGIDEADKVIPDYQIQSLEDAARSEASDEAMSLPTYSEHSTDTNTESDMTPAELAAQKATLDQREQAIATREAAFAERESAQAKALRHAEHVAFCESLVQTGQLLPAKKDRWVQFMDALDVAGVVEFGENDKPSHIEFIKAELKAAPKLIEFGEHKQAGEDHATGTASFVAPAGFSVDVEAVEKHAKALDYQKANPGISYTDAVKAVSAA